MHVGEKISTECCGCTACAEVCVHKAITMTPDSLGFLYPVVDENQCTNCGLCVKTCQFRSDYNRYNNFLTPTIYGGRLKSTDNLCNSQSGGASFALISSFLKSNGVVYGASFCGREFHVKHVASESLEDCEKFRGSKYVQSDLRGSFAEIKHNLSQGRRVLFTGTACQVAGLKSCIPQKYHKNLFTVDIVCHATPSPAVWEAYIGWIERKYGTKIVSVKSRDKKYGWRSYYETFLLQDGRMLKLEHFTFLFFNHIAIRPSCTNCKFTNLRRVGDITIADFWGWNKFHDEWNDDKGVSLCMANSEKGLELLNSSLDLFDIRDSSIEECLYLQPQLMKPSTANPLFDKFKKDFSSKGLEYVMRKYGDNNWKERAKKLLRPIVNFIKTVKTV